MCVCVRTCVHVCVCVRVCVCVCVRVYVCAYMYMCAYVCVCCGGALAWSSVQAAMQRILTSNPVKQCLLTCMRHVMCMRDVQEDVCYYSGCHRRAMWSPPLDTTPWGTDDVHYRSGQNVRGVAGEETGSNTSVECGSAESPAPGVAALHEARLEYAFEATCRANEGKWFDQGGRRWSQEGKEVDSVTGTLPSVAAASKPSVAATSKLNATSGATSVAISGATVGDIRCATIDATSGLDVDALGALHVRGLQDGHDESGAGRKACKKHKRHDYIYVYPGEGHNALRCCHPFCTGYLSLSFSVFTCLCVCMCVGKGGGGLQIFAGRITGTTHTQTHTCSQHAPTQACNVCGGASSEQHLRAGAAAHYMHQT